ncbi:MAG: apolipoprotein N-acyltransferase [Gammaproteobacteria bacterium]|nr:apolipoprotein N-acyltransferase [Gammaproteobacteria bacterium]
MQFADVGQQEHAARGAQVGGELQHPRVRLEHVEPGRMHPCRIGRPRRERGDVGEQARAVQPSGLVLDDADAPRHPLEVVGLVAVLGEQREQRRRPQLHEHLPDVEHHMRDPWRAVAAVQGVHAFHAASGAPAAGQGRSSGQPSGERPSATANGTASSAAQCAKSSSGAQSAAGSKNLAAAGAARERGSALLLGMIREEAVPAGEPPRYFNSILALDRELQFHDKHHLVPFAEFFPVPQFVRRWMRMMNLPYSDFTPGGPAQAPLRIAGLVLEASICYEDAYAATRLRGLRDATALVNVTNDAWFAHSPARYQHLQISRMRAIEARRFLIRAANDGVSAVVGPYGELQASAPEYRPAVLRAAVIPRTGLPPYARTGDLPLTVAAVLLVLAAAWLRWRSAGASSVAGP